MRGEHEGVVTICRGTSQRLFVELFSRRYWRPFRQHADAILLVGLDACGFHDTVCPAGTQSGPQFSIQRVERCKNEDDDVSKSRTQDTESCQVKLMVKSAGHSNTFVCDHFEINARLTVARFKLLSRDRSIKDIRSIIVPLFVDNAYQVVCAGILEMHLHKMLLCIQLASCTDVCASHCSNIMRTYTGIILVRVISRTPLRWSNQQYEWSADTQQLPDRDHTVE